MLSNQNKMKELKRIEDERIKHMSKMQPTHREQCIKYAPEVLEGMKHLMIRNSTNGINCVCFDSNSHGYDNHIQIPYTEFGPFVLELIRKENKDPNILIEFVPSRYWGQTKLEWKRVGTDTGNSDSSTDYSDNFYTKLVVNVEKYNEEKNLEMTKKEQETLAEAKKTYVDVKAKLIEAFNKGSNKIELNYMEHMHFDLHQKWIHEENPDIIMWDKRTSGFFSFGNTTYVLYYRNRRFYDSLLGY